MTTPSLYVPYGENEDFSLYRVEFDYDDAEDSWSIKNHVGTNENIRTKLENLQKYFDQRHYKTIKGGFQGINYKDKSFFPRINDTTPSIFLGLFLSAFHKVFRRNLVSTWTSIIVTGDINYDSKSGEMELISVGDIAKKYRAVEDFAQVNKGNHLFIAAGSDSEDLIPKGKNNSIQVKYFSPKDSIFDIMSLVFEAYTSGLETEVIDETQKKLLDNIDGGRPKPYFAPQNFEENIEKTFKTEWPGFLIYGEGESGKSEMAKEIARVLMRARRIYAPLLVNVESQQMKAEDFFHIICERLGITPNDRNNLDRLFAENKYLVIFDNLNENNTRLNNTLKEINNFFFSIPQNRPFLIITSRYYSDNTLKPNDIWPIKPSGLGEKEIDFLLRTLADQIGYSEKLKNNDTANEYHQFVSLVTERLGSTPGLIPSAANILRSKSFSEASTLLKNMGNMDLQQKIASIYKDDFFELSIEAKKLLFIMIAFNITDRPESIEEIFGFLIRHKEEKGDINYKQSVETNLQILLDRNFIYSREESGNTKYAIKTQCLLAFAFLDEFSGDYYPKEKIHLREKFMVNKLDIALEYNISRKYTAPLLQSIMGKDLTMDHLFTVSEYSSGIDNLELLRQRSKIKINKKDKDGETAFLRAAAYNPNEEVIKWFLNNLGKKDIITKNRLCYNALHLAAMFNTNPKVLELLVRTKLFNPEESITKGMSTGHHAFSFALYNNPSLDICKYFLDDLKCDVNRVFYVNAKHVINNTSLDEILDTDEQKDANLLTAKKFLKNHQKESLYNFKRFPSLPVLCAIFNQNIEVLREVLSHGVIVEKVTEYISVPLLLSVAGLVTQPEYLALLKEYGCDINGRDIYDQTALHHAAYTNGAIPVYDWLLENNIDINAENSDGDTAFQIALEHNPQPAVIEWFKKKGAASN